ncbi:hypothetical protein [Stenotrophomonas maltophilia]|uniref:hypothetical protein n=1 Tax=Stenotrophomonas maltophilia TaxID=40324 RepID=UPI00066E0C76|nr:hypothetical protein [Stenotrophomonas maltophilia]
MILTATALPAKQTSARRVNRLGAMEIPAGHIVRVGNKLHAKPVRNIGPRDEEMLQLAVKDFGFLLQPNAVLSLAGFASCIELYTRDLKARRVADTLHRLSA